MPLGSLPPLTGTKSPDQIASDPRRSVTKALSPNASIHTWLGWRSWIMLELNRAQKLIHPPTNTKSWYANRGTPNAEIDERLAELAPLYQSVSGGGFGNLTGDAAISRR